MAAVDLSTMEKELMETLYEMGGEANVLKLAIRMKQRTEKHLGMPATLTFVTRMQKMGLLTLTGSGYGMQVKAVHAKPAYEALTGKAQQ